MIDLTVDDRQLARTVRLARERNIVIPPLAWQKNPDLIPGILKARLEQVSLWDIDSANLLRITWKNEPRPQGGLFGGVNWLELPPQLTGVPARIIGLVGKWFPTGAHKVGATFGCLIPRLVTGQFDPEGQKAVWPSTGNYCRGGAYNSQLLACESIAVLPEGMSRERFDWLAKVAGEIIPTPGSESNVKEIFDKCKELEATRDNVVIFNQFDQLGNYLWHYEVTGSAMVEVLEKGMEPDQQLAGLVLTTGSAGTLAAGDRLKQRWPASKIAASEALQCPTLYCNGFGAHRIEGIGDKHVPWIHNVANTDVVIAIDDNDTMALLRLFNEPAGQELLLEQGVPEAVVKKLDLLGISGIANLLSAIKYARYFELTRRDVVMTVFTDSMDMYRSRQEELAREFGSYRPQDAIADLHKCLWGQRADYVRELSYRQRKAIHNLKYYTWVEQQGRDVEELNAQWYDRDYWLAIQGQASELDALIADFNRRTGLVEL